MVVHSEGGSGYLAQCLQAAAVLLEQGQGSRGGLGRLVRRIRDPVQEELDPVFPNTLRANALQ
jgi:hypothetical protein